MEAIARLRQLKSPGAPLRLVIIGGAANESSYVAKLQQLAK
jgi:hypothetical protein